MSITRGFSTLIGAAVAGFLIWLAVQIGTETSAEYWASYGLIAGAGLTMALSQLAGGWTKWGRPRLSPGVFLLGFLPVLVVGGWVLLARQPADFFNTSNWSRDLGIMGPVGDLGEALAAISFLIGLTFGLMFDTAGARRELADERSARERRLPAPVGAGAAPSGRVERTPEGAPAETRETVPAGRTHYEERGDGRTERNAGTEERRAADEPLTAERHEHDREHGEHEAEREQHGRRRGFRRAGHSGRREDT